VPRGSSVGIEEWSSLQRNYADLEARYWKEYKEHQVLVANLSSQIEILLGEISTLKTISSLAPVIPILNQKWAQEDVEIQKLLRPLVVNHLLRISGTETSSQ
jgi:hypothetical protein